MKILQMLFIVMIAASLLIAGCDLFGGLKAKNEKKVIAPPTEPQVAPPTAIPAAKTPPTVKTTPPPAVAKASGAVLWQYDKIREYEYRITSDAQGQSVVINTKVRIASDTVDGKAAWRTESDIDTEGVTGTTKLWMDKATNKCLKIESVMSVAGQSFSTPAKCPEVDPQNVEVDETGQAKVTLVGTESVTVPAGTFLATKYTTEGTNSFYWVSASTPLPLKIQYTSAQGSSTMELVSYS